MMGTRIKNAGPTSGREILIRVFYCPSVKTYKIQVAAFRVSIITSGHSAADPMIKPYGVPIAAD
jgi:hypothetical protein